MDFIIKLFKTCIKYHATSVHIFDFVLNFTNVINDLYFQKVSFLNECMIQLDSKGSNETRHVKTYVGQKKLSKTKRSEEH